MSSYSVCVWTEDPTPMPLNVPYQISRAVLRNDMQNLLGSLAEINMLVYEPISLFALAECRAKHLWQRNLLCYYCRGYYFIVLQSYSKVGAPEMVRTWTSPKARELWLTRNASSCVPTQPPAQPPAQPPLHSSAVVFASRASASAVAKDLQWRSHWSAGSKRAFGCVLRGPKSAFNQAEMLTATVPVTLRSAACPCGP
jgi:hypothetical protein